MTEQENKITKSLEDYIEFIYLELIKNKELRAIDIANYFNISRASVSEALIKLCEKNMIIYEGRKGIRITQKGIDTALNIIKKHKILSDFFQNILGIDDKTSSKNACQIEHVIDDLLVDKIDKFSDFCLKNKINDKFLGMKDDK